jgi:F0F1-type ATP synthase assembly protein I
VVRQRRSESDATAQASKYVGAGFTLALSLGLFLYLGVQADRWLDTGPWFTLIGTFVGAGAGFWYMYYHLVVEPRHRKERKE